MKRLWWRLALTLLILGLAGRAPAVVNSRGLPPSPGIKLFLPASYVAISPVSRALDALTLLSIPQTLWFFGLLIVCAVAVIASSPKRDARSRTKRLGLTLLSAIMVCIASEVSAIALPRPMARLSVDDPQVIRVDFHSHTMASHDANQRFTAERNREWHSSGGFDLAYITDHVKWGGAIAARRGNPLRAGDGTSLLTGVEGHHHQVSTVLLGFYESDSAVLNGWGELKPGATGARGQPVAIAALPANLDSVVAAVADTLPIFSAVELVDAAPRGLTELDRDEDRIRAIAQSSHLVLVASSNNHGWGRTVAAWNLMTIPGWRGLTPDSVGRLVEASFRNRDVTAVTIVERERPRVHGIETPFALPLSFFQAVGSLTLVERAVWLAWVWGSLLIVLIFHRTRSSDVAERMGNEHSNSRL